MELKQVYSFKREYTESEIFLIVAGFINNGFEVDECFCDEGFDRVSLKTKTDKKTICMHVCYSEFKCWGYTPEESIKLYNMIDEFVGDKN